jgi:hypothetical protein
VTKPSLNPHAFNERGVQIMSPSYRLDPDRPKIVPKDQWLAGPAKSPDDDRPMQDENNGFR